jgi:hypothetical protein
MSDRTECLQVRVQLSAATQWRSDWTINRTLRESNLNVCPKRKTFRLYKIWGVHGGDYEECRLLGYKIPIHISQGKHYVSATDSSRLMICKSLGFLRLWLWRMPFLGCGFGFQEPHDLTSKKTAFIQASDKLKWWSFAKTILKLGINKIKSKIWGFHGGDYEEWCLLGCYVVWLL